MLLTHVELQICTIETVFLVIEQPSPVRPVFLEYNPANR